MLQAGIVSPYYTISTIFDATTDTFSMLRNAQNGRKQDIQTGRSAQNETLRVDILAWSHAGMEQKCQSATSKVRMT